MRSLAEFTEGMSGSDLKELCRNAAMLPVRETIRRAEGDIERLARAQGKVCLPFPRFNYSVTRYVYQDLIHRSLTIEDFF
jgi:SpoVK/Ycf46/Vps4 family AAA+-type ATPase